MLFLSGQGSLDAKGHAMGYRTKSALPSRGAACAATVAVVVIAAGLVAIPTAYGATVVGCDTADLITAITNANASGRGTLDLSADCTYALTSAPYSDGSGPDGLPIITGTITIHGNGATITGGSGRLFEVAASGGLKADHLTLSHGSDASGHGGGAILNDGGVSLTNSTVVDNSSYTSGGAIYNNDGTVTLGESTVSDNTAGGTGGAVVNYGTMIVANSSVSGNSTSGDYGAGIANSGGDGDGLLTVTNSTISGNTNSGGSAGGIFNGGGGTVNLVNSTVSDNVSNISGGGIYDQADVQGSVTLTNSTVSGNSAPYGGGIYNESKTTLMNSTVAANTATVSGGGGGIWSDGSVVLTSSIVAENSSKDCESGTTISDDGYNLDSDGTCQLSASTDKPDTDPQLGPLQTNGGLTTTMALESTSPAIDAIPPGTNGCGTSITTDQRGVLRPQGSGCDIGAYEYGDVAMQSLTASPNPVPTLTKLTYTATVVNAGGAKAQGVKVTDTLPVGEKFKSAAASRGSCSVSASTVTCILGKMSAATLATVTIVVKVKASSGSMLSNTASVSATTGDTGFGNQSLTVNVKVT